MENILKSKPVTTGKVFFAYVMNGQIIVDFGRWLVLYCGRVSETALLMATLWVTATFVAPELTGKLGGLASTLSSFSLIAFSLLPEVILFSAIIKSLLHWKAVRAERRNPEAWAWALLYSIPTLAFFIMTVYTICLFMFEGGHIQQATGFALAARCLAGWFYSLVGLIHAGLGKHSQNLLVHAQEQIDQLTAELTHKFSQERDDLVAQSQAKQTALEDAFRHKEDLLKASLEGSFVAMESRLKEETKQTIADLERRIEDLQKAGTKNRISTPSKTGERSLRETLEEEMKEGLSQVLINYPIVEQWLSAGHPTISLQEIIEGTKHTPQMIYRRAKDGSFSKTKREGYVKLDSVIKWLAKAELPKGKERNTDPIPLLKSESNGHAKAPVSPDEFTPLVV